MLYFPGKLRLKIPFKDIWNAQIDVIIEELFILVVPLTQVVYDEEKELKVQLDIKRKEFRRIEKMKRLAKMKREILKIQIFLENTMEVFVSLEFMSIIVLFSKLQFFKFIILIIKKFILYLNNLKRIFLKW